MKDTPTNEFLPASSLSVILGLHDRSKDVEARRLTNCQTLFYLVFLQQETYPSQQSDCPQELLKAYERHRTFKTR